MPTTRWDPLVARVRGRLARYLVVTVVQIVLGEALLAVFFGALHWSALRSNLTAIAIGTGPAYYVARRYVWQMRGPSHFRREVLPFWMFSFVGAFLTTAGADAAERIGRSLTDQRGYQTLLVMGGTLFAAGVVWIARFFALDVLFERAVTASERAA